MTETEFRSGFVALVGRPNVGKSTLLNRILGQKIAITSSKPQTTRNRILGVYHFPGGQALFLDTPGLHQGKGALNRFMVGEAINACQGVDQIVMVTDVEGDVLRRDGYCLDMLKKAGRPAVLAINQIDRISHQALLPVIESFAEVFPFRAIVPVSALKGSGVDDLIEVVCAGLPPGPSYYPEDIVTDLPERFIAAEMVREQLLKQTGQEIPYGVAVDVERFEEQTEKGLVVIGAVIYLERESQKHIVLGKGGAKIRDIGRAARLQIETLLGCRVYLELFVKVSKNWTRSAARLREFGYH